MLIFYLMVIAMLGAIAPVQTSANSEAQGYLKSPFVSSLNSFATGTLLLLIICIAVHHGFVVESASVTGLPWWAWCGGAAGMIGITANIFLFPRLGSMQTVLMPMVGQIVMGIFIDSFGLFGSPEYPVSATRMFGFALVMVGIFYVVSHKGKHFRRKDTLGWQFLGNLAGASLAIQPAMNSRLAEGTGSSLLASMVSFACGTMLLLLLCILLKEHRHCISRIFTERRPLWTWSGGLIGVCIVVGQTLIVKHVGVGLLTILNIFGMLACSVVIDHFGLLGAEKRPINLKKAIGLVMVAGGIVLINA